MDFSLLTYNVLFNRAYLELKSLIENYHPDIICLQEVDTDDKNFNQIKKLGYKLADYSNSFIKFGIIYGVTTFYNPNKFIFIESDRINLPRSFTESFLILWRIFRGGNKPRTVLEANFESKINKNRVSIFNVHLTPFATNQARLNQIKAIGKSVVKKTNPLIIAGDFNYIYARKQLEELMDEYSLKEATHNILFSFVRKKLWKYSFFEKIIASVAKLFPNKFTRMKTDYIFYKNLHCLETKRIDMQTSDHYPIISFFKF
jgi:endonuclease/exonuclease/phosphatase family metal-dependent hydrolase